MRTDCNSLRLRHVLAGAVAAGALFTLTSSALAEDAFVGWPMGGQNLADSRTQTLTLINPLTVGKLKQKWVFTTGGDVSATPAVIDNTVYFPDLAGDYYAVDAKSGVALWTKQVSVWTGVAGDYARNDPAVDGDLLILGDQAGNLATWSATGPAATNGVTGGGAKVIAVNRHTGALVWVSQADAFPTTMVTSSPVVYNGVIYVGIATAEEITAATPGYPCCVSKGSLVAMDAATGKKLWQTHTVPSGYSGGSIWGSTPVVDVRRNSVYVGTGNNFSSPASVKACVAAAKSPAEALACSSPRDYFDAVLAMDLNTGAIKWGARAMSYDTWNVSCFREAPGAGNCPTPTGPDYDFGGSGPNLISMGSRFGWKRLGELVGIGEKSGIYWALDPDTGAIVWKTQVGPGSAVGGVEWGTAFDGRNAYVPISNAAGATQAGYPGNGGSWAALDPTDGNIRWQVAAPGQCISYFSGQKQNCMALGPVSVAAGVVFAGSMDTNAADPTMFALDASDGKVLWSFAAGSSVISAPAIAGDSIYWGAGYRRLGPEIGTGNNKLFAFSLGEWIAAGGALDSGVGSR